MMRIIPSKVRKRLATAKIKIGRPALPWTTAQDIQLINLVADTDILLKDIASAIAAENFAPSIGTCRNRFKQATGLEFADFRISDRNKRAQRKDLSIQAFYAQRERNTSGKLTNARPLFPDLANNVQDRPSAGRDAGTTRGFNMASYDDRHYLQSNAGDQATPDLSPTGLLSVASTTPADSSMAFPTPTTEIFEGRTAVSKKDCVDYGDSVTAARLCQDTATQSRKKLGQKRFIDVEKGVYWASDQFQDRPLDSAAPQFLKSTKSMNGIRRSGGNTVPIDSISDSSQQDSALDTTQVTPSAVTKSQTANAIAEKHASIEDRTAYPRGFLAHVKAGFRHSVASLVSSGTRRSRWSFRRTSRIVPTPLRPRKSSEEITSSSQKDQLVDLTSPNSKLLKLLTQCLSPADQIALAVSYLIDEGADVNCRDARGQMPLHLALDHGLHGVCKILLDNNADVYARTADGAKLSEHGRVILDNSTNNPRQYAAIKLCRHLIRSHNQPHQIVPIGEIQRAENPPIEDIGKLQKAAPANIETLDSDRLTRTGTFQISTPRLITPPVPDRPFLGTGFNGSFSYAGNVQTGYETEPYALNAALDGSQTNSQAFGTYNEINFMIDSNHANEQPVWTLNHAENYEFGSSHARDIDSSAFQPFNNSHSEDIEHAGDLYSVEGTTFPGDEGCANPMVGLELSNDTYVPGPQNAPYISSSYLEYPPRLTSETQENLQAPMTLAPQFGCLPTGELVLLYILPTPPQPRPGLHLMLQETTHLQVPHMAWIEPSSGIIESPALGRIIARDISPTFLLDKSTNELNLMRKENSASDSHSGYRLPDFNQTANTWENSYLTNDPLQSFGNNPL